MERWRRFRHPGVYRTEREPSRPKLTISRRIAWRFLWLGLILILLGGGLWLFFGSAFFVVRTVSSSGEVTPELVAALEGLKGRHIFLIRERAIQETLAQLDPSVARVAIVKGFPDQLQINVARRHPELIWRAGETEWFVDPSGIAFPRDPTLITAAPVIFDLRSQPVTAGQKIVSPEFINFAKEVIIKTPELIDGSVVRAEIDETTFQLQLVTGWGWQILFDTTRPPAGQLASLQLILKDYRDKIHEYADLRLVGWAYLK